MSGQHARNLMKHTLLSTVFGIALFAGGMYLKHELAQSTPVAPTIKLRTLPSAAAPSATVAPALPTAKPGLTPLVRPAIQTQAPVSTVEDETVEDETVEDESNDPFAQSFAEEADLAFEDMIDGVLERNGEAARPKIEELIAQQFAQGTAVVVRYEVKHAVRDIRGQLGACYAQTSMQALTATAHFTIAGSSDGTQVAMSTITDATGNAIAPQFAGCLQNAFESIQLPALNDDQTIEVNYPIVFTNG